MILYTYAYFIEKGISAPYNNNKPKRVNEVKFR